MDCIGPTLCASNARHECARAAAVCKSRVVQVGLRASFHDPDELTRVRKWQCIVCGWIYDEALGYADEGIAPGTAWEKVPADFVCPECGVSKEDFEMIEVG